MNETLHIKDCPVCSSRLSITHDKTDDTITLRPENLPPLLKDKLEIVNTYKRIKGLDSKWQKAHGARAIVYAGQLIEAAGPLGGAIERCCGLLAWLKESGKEFDLGSAASYFMAYSAHLASKLASEKSRCNVCGESFYGSGYFCDRHL